MKLSPSQIEQLYTFTRQHYVEYYDLQTELVDHLANAIEEQWKENPKLSFEEALQIEFKKFDVFGFSNVVEQRRKVLNKKYNSLIWKHFKAFFKIPKIIITVFFFIVYYKAAQTISHQQAFMFGCVFFLFVMLISKALLFKKQLKNKFKKTQKKWLYEETIFNVGMVSVYFQLPVQLINFISHLDSTVKMPPIELFVFCLFLYLMFIFSYIIVFIIPSKAEEYLKQTYPEYEFSK